MVSTLQATTRVVNDISIWLGPLSEFGLLLLGIPTLLYLKRYADDTRTLAKSSLDQIEQGYIPYIMVREQAHTGMQHQMSFVNEGKGPTVNVTISYEKYQHELPNGEVVFKETTTALPDFAVTSKPFSFTDRLSSQAGAVIRYHSLTGKAYETKLQIGITGPVKTTFKRIE